MSSTETWFVYMIRSDDNSLYTGISTNVIRRFKEHKSKSKLSAKYLRVRNVVSLDYIETAADRSAASKRECQIKKMSKLQKERLITSFYDGSNTLA